MAQIKLTRGLLANLPAAIADGQVLFTTDKGHIYLDNGSTRIELYKEDLDAINASITTLNGDASTSGSVSKAIADLSSALKGGEGAAAADETIAGAKAYADAAVSTLNTALAAIAKSGKASDVAIDDTAENFTATTVEAALAELATSLTNASTAGAVTIDTTTTTEGAAKSYTVKQGTSTIGVIDIPKDMVVSSGSVEVNPSGQPAGTYLVLTLANATSDKVYINVASLIEYVTSGSNAGDMVVITIDEDHKVTAEITDGTITKAKLVTAVQTSLAAADSAVQPAELAVTAEAGKYISAITVDGDGNITFSKEEVGLNWGTF